MGIDATVPTRVLVIDDEGVVADTLAAILKSKGFDATAVYSGENGVEAAKTLEPALLISDATMDGMSGIEAATKILDTVPTCRIVLISGREISADELEIVRARGCEPKIFLKPVHPQAVLDCLSELTLR